MNVPIHENTDPKSNLVTFKSQKREGSLKPIRKSYDSCRHKNCYVDEGKRQVTCRKCGIILDAFQVLYEMALKQRMWLEELDEWDALRDSRLSDRYDMEWERESGEVKSPPSDPEAVKAWNVFKSYFGEKFVSMYRRKHRLRSGPDWYGRSTYGACVSFEYARQQLIPKVTGQEGR